MSLKQVLAAAMACPEEFSGFDVLGITEKGLGVSPLERMLAIARLRRALDEAGCQLPIHIFGSFDPLSICLYTMAGAEIFDGLTWLRYAFTDDDQCVYLHSHATLNYGLSTKDTAQRLRVISSNYYYLLKLQGKLRHFAATGDFNLLPLPKVAFEVPQRGLLTIAVAYVKIMSSGGRRSRWLGSSSAEALQEKMRQAENEARSDVFDAEVERVIGETLAVYNDRDAEAVQEILDKVKEELGKEFEVAVELRFGGSVSKHTYVDGLSDVDALVLLPGKLASETPEMIRSLFAERLRA